MKVKEHFMSRFGSDGVLLEADWTGLEIAGWAFITRDPTVIRLLNEKRDMHRYVGSMVLGKRPEDITDQERKKLKPANFTLIYGGTDWNLVEKDGLEKDFAKEVYDTFWRLFPVARLWADNTMKLLDATAFYTKDFSKDGQDELWSSYTGITGRKFFLKAYPEKVSDFTVEQKIYTRKGFKYAEGMNYKIQSFCTADLHMIAMGLLFREAIKHRDEFLLINTIHDSGLMDCKKEYLTNTCKTVKSVLCSVIERLKKVFNIDFDVPLDVELKQGSSWANMEKVNEVTKML